MKKIHSRSRQALLIAVLLLLLLNKTFAQPISLTPDNVAALPVIGNINNANDEFFRGSTDLFTRTDFATSLPSTGILRADTLYRVTPILFASGSGNVQFTNFRVIGASSTTLEMASELSITGVDSNFTFSVGFFISDFLSPPFFGLFKADLSEVPDSDAGSFFSSFTSVVGLESNLTTDTSQLDVNLLNPINANVPEPSVPGLLIIGFAAIGFARRNVSRKY